jgi:uncharacterized protein (TIGR04255 family)
MPDHAYGAAAESEIADRETDMTTGQPSALAAFPETPRVIYAKNPLLEVICQLRFPAILKIDSEIPAGFQEKLRLTFPLFREEELLPIELPAELAPLIKAARPQSSRKTWKFISEDEQWTVALTRDFVSLSTEHYTRWEHFREKVELICDALQEEYQPSFLTRIGLRYRDLILRSTLGLSDVPWSDLLQPHIVPEYSMPAFADVIQDVNHQLAATFLEEKVKLGLRHGTAQLEDHDERGYLVDSDLYSDTKTGVDNAIERLNLFNRIAGRIFRWCITDRLHRAMEPESI